MNRRPRSPSRPKSVRSAPAAPTRKSLDRLEQVRILAHPLRLHLLELFAEAPRTTKQAADRLGLPATRLYHHVAALERVGLVRVRETRQNRGTIEKHYEAVERGFEIDLSALVRGKTKAARQVAARLAGAGTAALALRVLERAQDGLTEALDQAVRLELPPEDPRCPVALRVGIIGEPARVEAMRAELLALIESWSVQQAGGKDEGGAGATAPGGSVTAWLTVVWAPEPTR